MVDAMDCVLSSSALESQCRVAAFRSRPSECSSSSFVSCRPRGLTRDTSSTSCGSGRWIRLGGEAKFCQRLPRGALQVTGSAASRAELRTAFRGRTAFDRREVTGEALDSTGRRGGGCQGRRARTKGRAYCALASSFPSITRTERTLALPIDYYQILGAETHFLADSITRAYEARLAHPPREGYSQEALLSRVEILRGARDTLADPEWREDYNLGLDEDEAGTLVVDVPWSKVSGALCSLQEAGEAEVVLEAGNGLLNERLPKVMRRDVVLSMALAYVELSREAMAETVPTVLRSCDLLEVALKLLQDEGGSSLASGLQEQIEETLEELTPRCVLELLAFPVDKEHETHRQDGLQGLKSILWAVGEGGAAAAISGFTREQFIKDAFSFLTAAEQVNLWNATPDNVPAESFEVYAVALAHVAEGYAVKRPQLIVRADELFWQLQGAQDADVESGVDYSVERAMCRLLMGEVDESMSCLGLQDESQDWSDPAVIDFVYSHSEGSEDGDLLPGLCKLLEDWLGEVVFPTFRDTEMLQVRLGDYYDDPQVISILEEWEATKGGSSALSRIGAALGSIKTSAVHTLQKVFPFRKGSEPHQSLSSELTRSGIDHSLNSANSEYEPYGFNGSSVNDASSTGIAAASGSSRSGYGWGNSDLDGGSTVSSSKSNGAVRSSSKVDLSTAQIATSGILFGVLVMAGLQFLPSGSGWRSLRGRDPPATMARSSSGVVSTKQAAEVTKMDARLAEQIVRKWQAAKARALGSTHSVSHLSEVLEGKMLESWTDRVNEVARKGWYWEYRLVGLNIDSVTVSDDGRKSIVEATLQEAARLFDGEKPEHKDSYRSTYTTRYELQFGVNDWRITGGVVLRS